MILPPQAPVPDSVRAVLRDIFAQPAYEWATRRSPMQVFLELWRELARFLETLADAHPVGYIALLFASVVILALLFTHLGFVVARALRQGPAPESSAAAPLAPPRDAAWHLAQARRLAQAARFAEALGHRFEALVYDLERRRALVVRASRTPAEYAREVKLDGEGTRSFAALVGVLYGALFGGRPCSADDFDAFDREATALVRRA